MQNRKAQLYALGKKLLCDRFIQNLTTIHQEVQKSLNNQVTRYQNASNEIFEQAVQMQKKGDMNAIAFFLISPLQSSLLTGSNSVQLALYDKDFYFSEEKLLAYWNPEFIYSHMKGDMEFFSKNAKKELIRTKEYEIKDYGLEYAANYHSLTCSFCSANMDSILLSPSFQQMNKSVDFKVLFGEYMMPMLQIYPVLKEETV